MIDNEIPVKLDLANVIKLPKVKEPSAAKTTQSSYSFATLKQQYPAYEEVFLKEHLIRCQDAEAHGQPIPDIENAYFAWLYELETSNKPSESSTPQASPPPPNHPSAAQAVPKKKTEIAQKISDLLQGNMNEETAKALATAKESFPLLQDLIARHGVETPVEIVEGILLANLDYLVNGPAKEGKSSLVEDMLLHVAHNMEWAEKAVKQSLVIWQASESGRQHISRAIAWRQAHGIPDTTPLPYHTGTGKLYLVRFQHRYENPQGFFFKLLII